MANEPMPPTRLTVTAKEARSSGSPVYFSGKPCAHGHVCERFSSNRNCIKCASFRSAAWEAANPDKRAATNVAWASATPERKVAAGAAWRASNSERKAATTAAWRASNSERVKATTAAWKADNPERVKATRRVCCARIRATQRGNLDHRMSGAISKCLSGIGGKAGKSWADLVGYSVDQLRAHIERQFTKGMSWKNRRKWHIDHILPLSSFAFTSPDDAEFKSAWALSNLRPLWSEKNIAKAAKREFLL
jgi:phage terminase Nu1 subunit (DNA packaging protein)